MNRLEIKDDVTEKNSKRSLLCQNKRNVSVSTGSGSEIVTPLQNFQKTGQYAKLVQVSEFSSH